MDVHLKNLVGRFHEQFGSGPGLGPASSTCLMKVEGVTASFIKSLYRAGAALYRTDPWRRLRPGHFFGVRVGKNSEWPGRVQPFPCVQFIGGDGGDLAFYLYRSENDAQEATKLRETVPAPNTEIMRVTFEKESLMFPCHKKMIKSLALEGTEYFPVFDVVCCNSDGELRYRIPMFEELRFVYASMRGMTLVHPLLQEDVQATTKWSQFMRFEPFIETVDVQWPAGMAKGNDIVAVTVSHPPGQAYEEKSFSSANSTTTEYTEPTSEDHFLT
ncbi:uncharacterized protein LOC110731355 [Chenopodium quinoa]|nr:uncharacterized protein LOC110731355 [Chenopodium quinoa]